MAGQLMLGKPITMTLGVIALIIVSTFAGGSIRNTAEAAFSIVGIDLGEPDYIMNLQAKVLDVNTGKAELSWIVPEGKGDFINSYRLYNVQRQDLTYEEKNLVGRDFADWSNAPSLNADERKWVFDNLNYGWHLFKLVAVTKTGEDEKEAAVWVPSVAEEACSAITDVHLRDDCYKKHVSEGRVDELLGKKICERLITTGNNKNDCYRWLAINTNKEEYCEEIQEHAYVSIYIDIRWKKVQNECYTKIAANKGDTAICEKITEKYEEQYRQREWDRCYLEVAKNAENKEACKKACEQIKDKYEKECYDECEKKPE